nr:hypothetical protein [Clavibacter michiganensis]
MKGDFSHLFFVAQFHVRHIAVSMLNERRFAAPRAPVDSFRPRTASHGMVDP